MITISIGAVRTKGVKQSKQLFEKADKALYIAKEKGKNSYAMMEEKTFAKRNGKEEIRCQNV